MVSPSSAKYSSNASFKPRAVYPNLGAISLINLPLSYIALACTSIFRRRAHLQDKQTDLPLYKQLADPIVQLLETGLSNLAISRQLKTSDATVAKAIKWWYDSRELPVPFAADRRRKMLVQAKAMYDNGKLIKDIAPKFGYTARGLKLALLEYFAELGETMPDGRSRRGNAGSGESANGHNDPDDE